jgi:chromosome segregation ATPase
MSDINYNEKVVIPFLEKKCKDLLSLNLVLEAKLLVEQNRSKDVGEQFEEFSNKDFNQLNRISDLERQIADLIQEKSQIESSRNEAHQREMNELRNQKTSVETERNELSAQALKLETDLKRETSVKDSINLEYSKLKMHYDNLQLEFDNLKTSINNKKVKEPKLV